MLVGEMTVTLQDVMCLWGLPVDGIPGIGISDDNWTPLVDTSFERQIDASAWMSKQKGTGDHKCFRLSDLV
jgi:hypothetical protein